MGTQKCNCEEASCKDNCSRNHTHKTFSCKECDKKDPLWQTPPVATDDLVIGDVWGSGGSGHKDTPETMEERFDHRTELCSHDGGFKYCIDEDFHEEYESGDFDVDLIKDFIKEEISLAISSHNKELVEKVEGMQQEMMEPTNDREENWRREKWNLQRTGYNQALKDFSNLIKDSKK